MVEFNHPAFTGKELDYIKEAITYGKLCGDGAFTARCSEWIRETMNTAHVLLTPSCTHALEMAAYLSGVGPGDEVIMPSYTFVSTADAFVLQGASIVFVDIDPRTMNIDPERIKEAITKRSRAIVPVHYAGVACDMDAIADIAEEYHLSVIEDAAQGVNAFYKGRALGSIGDFGCYSFRETKNYTMGEGGALLFQADRYLERAEILREKGTDRSKFFRGQIDKYTWVNYGSSYLPSELNAAYLWAQLESAEIIYKKRMKMWETYHERLEPLEKEGYLQRPYIPEYAKHNAHMYYIKVKDLETRSRLIEWLKENEIQAVFHYIPLHSSPAGKKYGRFCGQDIYTTKESERLLRLPLHYHLTEKEAEFVTEKIKEFFC